METWEKELLLTNAIRQARVESIEKAVDTDLEKARQTKYFKREGTPGHYKYYYTEAEYKQAKGGAPNPESDNGATKPSQEEFKPDTKTPLIDEEKNYYKELDKDRVKQKLFSSHNVSNISKLDGLKLDGTDSAVDLSRALNLPIDGTNFSELNKTIKNMAEGKKESEKKVPSSKEIANIFKNKDWGDIGDRISASGNQLEVADSFYAGGKDKLNSIKKEWIDPNGFMAKYMKDEHGVKFTLHSEDIQDTASGKYKKFGKYLGAAIVRLNIEKA